MECPVSLLRGMTMKFLLSNGEYSRKNGLDFPVAQELATSKLLVVCTEADEKIVAVCGIRSLLNVLVLHVREGYRRQGIGTQLLTRAIQAAEKRRLGFITLSVSSDNVVAFHLYCKFGFKEVMVLRKSRQVLMMLPLTLMGKLTYAFFHMPCLLLPNTFLLFVHSWLYRRTLRARYVRRKTKGLESV